METGKIEETGQPGTKLFNELILFHLNVQSLNNKILELEVLLTEVAPDIFCISEHWLQNTDVEKVNLQNYKLVSYYSRKIHRGGGTAIFVQQRHKTSNIVTTVTEIEKHFEFCISEVKTKNKSYILICIYRSPTGDLDTFSTKINDTLSVVYSPHKHIILCGDFNIDFSVDDDVTTSLFQIFQSFGMEKHVRGMTRVTSVSATQIDNIFSNINTDDLHCEVHVTNVSDHYGQILKFKVEREEVAASYSRKRHFNNNNITTFVNFINAERFYEVTEASGTDNKYDTFFKIFFFHFDRAFPSNICKVKNSFSNWVSPEIKRYSSYIKDLYVRHKQTNNPEALTQYKSERKHYKKMLSNYKKSLNENKIINSKNKAKSAWNIFNSETNKRKVTHNISLHSDGLLIEDPQEVARIFARQFTLPAQPLNDMQFIPDKNYPTIFLTPVTEQEVYNIIMSLPNKFSAGVDEVPVCLLKHVAAPVSPPLADIINECFMTGTFPSRLKIAKVTPVHKKGDIHNVANYRPISVLSSMSKVIERAIYSRIMQFINLHHILTEHQYGFRPKRSTELAIFSALKFIMEGLDHNEKIAGLYFDLSKAFDTVDHSLLIQKLEKYGIRGLCALLIKSYITERQQLVCIAGDGGRHLSEPAVIGRGVAQGSILGPLLFLIYANSLCDGFVSGLMCQYADDTSVMLAHATLAGLSEDCSRAAAKMSDWCRENNLKLNEGKTGLILFGKTKQNESLLARLNHRSIPVLDNIGFLGVHIDPQLNWSKHIDVLTSKLNSYCCLLRRLREVLTTDSIKLFYFACIQSIISYGILFWGASSGAIRVFRAQKRILRVIYKLHPRTSCKPYFSGMGILTAPSLYFQSLVLFTRRYPHLFQTNADRYAEDMSVVTRGRGDLSIPLHQSTFFERSSLFRAIKAYNMLPSNIKDITQFKLFKSRVVQYLTDKKFYSFSF